MMDTTRSGYSLCNAVRWRYTNEKAISESPKYLNLNVIKSNKMVSHEAARVFYMRNTFSFIGEHNWDLIVSWLEGIGSTNRNSLASLEINAYRPDPAWQLSNGDRIKEPNGWTMEVVYPRHPYLQLPASEERLPRGRVNNINPAVEIIFVLLGQRTSKQKTKVVMKLDQLYPGARKPYNLYDSFPESSWYSMDLPNLIEKSRSLHAPEVGVIWTGNACRQELEGQRPTAEDIGWDVWISPIEEDELHPDPEYHGCHAVTNEWRIAKFMLRRKELSGALWAQDPCPDSFLGYDDDRYN